MNRVSILAFAFFALLSSTTLSAQGLSGSYELQGRANVTLEIRALTVFPPVYVGAVYVDDKIIPGETMLIYPTEEGWAWRNNNGNDGSLKQDDDGNLEAEVGSGPNKGKKTKWKKA